MVGRLAALVLAALALDAAADIGPRHPNPARDACNGLQDGAACTVRGKAGTCHGPHPSRIFCEVTPPSQGSGSATDSAGSAATGTPANSATGTPANTAAGTPANSAANNSATGGAAAGSAQAPEPAATEPSSTPGHKRGCAVADPGSLAPVGAALAALALRRRRRSRSMS